MMEFALQSLAVADAELRKVARDPAEVFSRAAQPILWLVVFGQVFGRIKGIPTGDVAYSAFLAPGILAQSVLFAAIFYGIAAIWERDLGIVHKLLASPAYRGALVFGKALSAGARGLVQMVLIYAVIALMGIPVRLGPGPLFGVIFAVLLGSAAFATFSLAIACLVKTRERFMGIGQLLTMPLFFASNAIYPISLMPGWLQALAKINPLTYLVDALRQLMLVSHGQPLHGLGADFGVLCLLLAALITISTRLYPSLIA